MATNFGRRSWAHVEVRKAPKGLIYANNYRSSDPRDQQKKPPEQESKPTKGNGQKLFDLDRETRRCGGWGIRTEKYAKSLSPLPLPPRSCSHHSRPCPCPSSHPPHPQLPLLPRGQPRLSKRVRTFKSDLASGEFRLGKPIGNNGSSNNEHVNHSPSTTCDKLDRV